ncbi:hypothetical protein J4558_02340 [Leptolyngbya sp. 15MV]|nr:hypothetical protein J4558_02340 [Leptolyngbya sp. 15MV]
MADFLPIRGGIGADEPYWEALRAGEFRLARCAGCGEWMWPAHFRCGACGSWSVDWPEVVPEGRIYTWTRNHAVGEVVAERRGDLPYVTMLVELPHAGGARVAGVLDGSDEGLAVGTSGRGVIRPPEPRAKGYATMAWEIVR